VAAKGTATAGVDVGGRIWIVQVDVVAVAIAIGVKQSSMSSVGGADFHVWADLMSEIGT
jgi:hypothetical protein